MPNFPDSILDSDSTSLQHLANIKFHRYSYDDLVASELLLLKKENVFNGLWGKGWFSFSELLQLVEQLPQFNNEKFEDFKVKLELQWNIHDYAYLLWGSFFDKLRADNALASWLFIKLHWAPLWLRIIVYFGTIIWLIKEGNKYFHYSK